MTLTNPDTFLQKIAAAAGEMDNPTKRSTNPHYQSKFANLGDTMDVIAPVLEKHGLGHATRFDGTVIVYEVFDPKTGEKLSSALELKDILAGLEGNVWQSIGQAFTYLRRYLSQAFWGLVPEDTDANDAPIRPPAAKKLADAKRDNRAEIAVLNSGGVL